MWVLYQILYLTLALAIGPWLLLRRGRHYLASLAPRLGRFPISDRSTTWVHAVSVGEVGVATSLTSILPRDRPLVVTTVTPSGNQRATDEFPDALVTYLPLELGFAVRRFFDRLQPAALVLCEGDLWPLVLREARRRSVPALVVNARISEQSFRRMLLIAPLLGPILDPIAGFAVQTELDRGRLERLGVASGKITVTGNLKFEIGRPSRLAGLEDTIRNLAEGRPVLIAGSTMRDEEPLVMDAFERLGGGERALLVLAPRHPERWSGVVASLEKLGICVGRRSELDAPRAETREGEGWRLDVLVLDSLGELAAVYGLGVGAFIGGTLVATGGHNPIEAACHGVAIAAGPSMHNFREIEQIFDDREAWQRVQDSAELAAAWDSWIRNPRTAAELGQRAAEVFESNQGALAKTEAFLAEHLSEDRSR